MIDRLTAPDSYKQFKDDLGEQNDMNQSRAKFLTTSVNEHDPPKIKA